MEAVEAGIGCAVNVGCPWAEVGDEMAADWGGSLVVVFVSCHVSIGKLHTIVTIFPTILPLLPLLRLRLSFLLFWEDPIHCILTAICLEGLVCVPFR